MSAQRAAPGALPANLICRVAQYGLLICGDPRSCRVVCLLITPHGTERQRLAEEDPLGQQRLWLWESGGPTPRMGWAMGHRENQELPVFLRAPQWGL